MRLRCDFLESSAKKELFAGQIFLCWNNRVKKSRSEVAKRSNVAFSLRKQSRSCTCRHERHGVLLFVVFWKLSLSNKISSSNNYKNRQLFSFSIVVLCWNPHLAFGRIPFLVLCRASPTTLDLFVPILWSSSSILEKCCSASCLSPLWQPPSKVFP